MNRNFSNNFKTMRKQRNLTQEQIAETLGVSCQAVSKWETNSSYPDISLLPIIADYFGVSVDYLKGETDTKVTPSTKIYEGFTAPEEQEININGDGTTEVIYNYSRNQYDLILNKGYGIKNISGADTYYYDEEIHGPLKAALEKIHAASNYTLTYKLYNGFNLS